MTAQDIKEFSEYLKNCTDKQIHGVCEKEKTARREDYVELTLSEAEHRGIYLDY